MECIVQQIKSHNVLGFKIWSIESNLKKLNTW